MKILVAEDTAISRLIVESFLHDQGHEVLAVENGRQALQSLEQDAYDILLLDWVMPEIDGTEVCRVVRSNASNRYTYIIMLTSMDGRQHQFEALKAGVDDFLVKPLDAEMLAARLVVAERILNLHQHLRTLRELVPMCMYCKRVRDDEDYWHRVEEYLTHLTGSDVSHGICEKCLRERHPRYAQDIIDATRTSKKESTS